MTRSIADFIVPALLKCMMLMNATVRRRRHFGNRIERAAQRGVAMRVQRTAEIGAERVNADADHIAAFAAEPIERIQVGEKVELLFVPLPSITALIGFTSLTSAPAAIEARLHHVRDVVFCRLRIRKLPFGALPSPSGQSVALRDTCGGVIE